MYINFASYFLTKVTNGALFDVSMFTIFNADLGDVLTESVTSAPDSVAMMQIDCEVTATRLLHIHKSAIPQDMRDNATFYVPPPPAAATAAPTATTQRAAPPSGKHTSQASRDNGKHLPRDSASKRAP